MVRVQATEAEYKEKIFFNIPGGSAGLPMPESFADSMRTNRMSKRAAVELKGVEEFMGVWEKAFSRAFTKRGVAKGRNVFPLDMISSMHIQYLQTVLSPVMRRCGWSELDKESLEIFARRSYILDRLSAGASATADDGQDFYESHTHDEM
eukprot:6394833-Amphidinium_carterae.1